MPNSETARLMNSSRSQSGDVEMSRLIYPSAMQGNFISIFFFVYRFCRSGISSDGSGSEEGPSTDYTKSIVFGGNDGILLSISVVSAAAGAQLSWQNLLIMAAAAVVAGAFATGIGEYISSKAHKEFVQAEKRRAQWEFKHDKSGRVKEMAKLFEFRGMSRADSELVVNKMAQYDGFFVNLMVTEELGLQPPEDDDLALFADACVMFFSYAAFGCIPLVIYPFASLYSTQLTQEVMYTTTILVTGVALFTLGSIKSTFRYLRITLTSFLVRISPF